MATKILHWDYPPLKVCTDPLTGDNNRNFARGSPTELFFFLSMAKVVSVPLTEYNNRNLERGSPTEIFLIFSLVKVVSAPLTERNNRNFARGSPLNSSFLSGFFGQSGISSTI